MKEFEIILRRLEENLIAVVRCESNASNQDEVMKKISKGVTTWIRCFEKGQNLWRYTCEDLNIGDLTGEVSDKNSPLHKLLSNNGIENLTISVYGTADSPSEYTYDTVLVEGM